MARRWREIPVNSAVQSWSGHDCRSRSRVARTLSDGVSTAPTSSADSCPFDDSPVAQVRTVDPPRVVCGDGEGVLARWLSVDGVLGGCRWHSCRGAQRRRVRDRDRLRRRDRRVTPTKPALQVAYQPLERPSCHEPTRALTPQPDCPSGRGTSSGGESRSRCRGRARPSGRNATIRSRTAGSRCVP